MYTNIPLVIIDLYLISMYYNMYFYSDRVRSATQSAENGRIPLSFDYIIVAEPIETTVGNDPITNVAIEVVDR